MGDLYSFGILPAAITSWIRLVIVLREANSIRAANFRRVGLYYHLWNGRYEGSRQSASNKALSIFALLICGPLLSWLSVFSDLWMWFQYFQSRSNTPPDLKKIQHRIATVELSTDDMVTAQLEIGEVLGVDAPVRTGRKWDVDDPHTLVLERGEWYSEVSVSVSEKTLTFYSHPPDYDPASTHIFQYKIENEKVWMKLISDRSRGFSGEEWDVRDGVVMETDIRSRYEKNKGIMFRSVDEIISDLKRSVEWNELQRIEAKHFVLERHPKAVPPKDLRRIARAEFERIKAGFERYKVGCRNVGYEIGFEGDELRYQCSENQTEAEKEVAKKFFAQDKFTEFGATRGEIESLPKLTRFFMAFLEDSKAA